MASQKRDANLKVRPVVGIEQKAALDQLFDDFR